MRTTLTLDDQLAKNLQEYARETRQSFKDVVNQALALGLCTMEHRTPPTPYQLTPASMGQLRVGNNLDKAWDLSAQLENEAIANKLEMRK
ncbi:hypothetical protein [Nitrosomonas sp.]|uniref:hypothetical protein n=1 Tax=Nitrosomonas sp. TaxID=42353 RepID=UPI0033067C94